MSTVSFLAQLDSGILYSRFNRHLLTIVTRNKIVWKLVRGYCLCYCKTFLLVPDSTEYTKICYLCHLRSNNIIGQRKTTNKEKHFYPWLTSFKLKLSCTWLILANSKYLLWILYIYCTNWLRVISYQEQINRLLVVIHHENINELASLRFLNLIMGWQNIKMGRKVYEDLFFSFVRLCSKSSSCNRIP